MLSQSEISQFDFPLSLHFALRNPFSYQAASLSCWNLRVMVDLVTAVDSEMQGLQDLPLMPDHLTPFELLPKETSHRPAQCWFAFHHMRFAGAKEITGVVEAPTMNGFQLTQYAGSALVHSLPCNAQEKQSELIWTAKLWPFECFTWSLLAVCCTNASRQS